MNGLLFDLGGTFLRAGVAGRDGLICHRSKIRICSVADGMPSPEIWRRILTSIVQYEAEHASRLERHAPVVLSFPGPIGRSRVVLQAPTVAGGGVEDFDLPAAIQAETGRPVMVLNDVSSAAWEIAERVHVQRFAVVTVSSGIGSKIFDRCHASRVLDHPPYAGEIGHVVVDDRAGAPICDCGGKGHLGAIASGRGIERIIRRRALDDPEGFRCSLLTTQFAAKADNLTNEEHIAPALLARDCWTSAIVCECTRHLVRSLLTVTMAAGLEKIFFIGGFANALGGRYLEIVRDLARDLSRYQVASDCLETLFESGTKNQETCLDGCAAFLRSQAAVQ